MRFSIEILEKNLDKNLSHIVRTTGLDVWLKRMKILERQFESHALWRKFLVSAYDLELTFNSIWKRRRFFKKVPRIHNTSDFYLHMFFYIASEVHKKLPNLSKKRFANCIKKALLGKDGLIPLAIELRVAALCMIGGFDVGFHDIENDGGFDFLLTEKDISIELECKYISPDKGRKIHRRPFYSFSEKFFESTRESLDQTDSGRVLEITVPDRLPSDSEEQNFIISLALEAIGRNSDINRNNCQVFIKDIPAHALPPPLYDWDSQSRDDYIHSYFRDFFMKRRGAYCIRHRKNKEPIVLFVESQKPDQVLREISKGLKDDTKRQFSGNRPAVLFVYFPELDDGLMQQVVLAGRRRANHAVHRMLNDLMKSRPFLHTIVFFSDGDIIQDAYVWPRKTLTTQEKGRLYFFKNSAHPLTDVPILEKIVQKSELISLK